MIDTAGAMAGHTDLGGRWYPAATARASCCDRIRTPSRTWPWTLYRHVRTARHIRTWIAEHAQVTDGGAA